MRTQILARALVAISCLIPLATPPATALGSGDHFGLRWSWANLGGDYAELEAGDVDGDGSDEILTVGCSGRCWVLWTRSTDGYRQFATSIQTGDYGLIRMVEVASDGRSAVLDARDGSGTLTITEWNDGVRSERSFPLPGGSPTDFLLTDLDGDLDRELLVADESNLYILDWETGTTLTTRAGFGGVDLAIGNIDEGAEPEIGIATGLGSCWVLDGVTLQVDWGVPSGCGHAIRFARVGTDPADAVVTVIEEGSFETLVRTWAPPATAQLYSSGPYTVRSGRIAIGDFDSDPGDDVVLGGLNENTLWLLRGIDGAPIEAASATVEPLELEVGDPDGDGMSEILVIGTSDFSIQLRVLDAEDRTVEFSSLWMSLRAESAGVGDWDNDGDSELITGGLSDSEFETTLAGAWVFSGQYGGDPAIRALNLDAQWDNVLGGFHVADVDDDGESEVCAAYRGSPSVYGCYEGIEFEPLWTTSVWGMAAPSLLMDVTGGPELDYLFPRFSETEDVAITATNSANGWPAWTTPGLVTGLTSSHLLCFGDFAGDPAPELLVAAWPAGGVALVDPIGGAVLSAVDVWGPDAMACGDIDVNGRSELLAAFFDGNVAILDPETGTPGPPILTGVQEPRAMVLGDLFGDAAPEIVIYSEGSLQVWKADGTSLLWSVSARSWEIPYLGVMEVDGDGSNELVWLDDQQLLVFGRPYTGSNLLIDGFETGNLSSWSRAAH